MRTLETAIPPRGLSIPCVTIVDEEGNLIEEDQRRLTRYLVQQGLGADVIFVMGTTGEWNRLRPATRQRAIQVVTEEVRKREHGAHEGLEAWSASPRRRGPRRWRPWSSHSISTRTRP